MFARSSRSNSNERPDWRFHSTYQVAAVATPPPRLWPSFFGVRQIARRRILLVNAKMRPMRSTERKTPQKVSLLTLVGIVVGSMVGGGVFTLPRSFGTATGVLGAIIAWIIAGTGMLMLTFVFQSLALRRPHLDSGVYIYAKTGFGNYAGFNSAFGYWASNVAENVFFLVFTMTTLGTFFPGLGEGNTFLAVALASACVWLFHYLIARGVRQAAAVNRIVTVAKLVPIVVFIIVVGCALIPTDLSESQRAIAR
jgi:arginine:ornithine antiporter / lysine permease